MALVRRFGLISSLWCNGEFRVGVSIDMAQVLERHAFRVMEAVLVQKVFICDLATPTIPVNPLGCASVRVIGG